MVAACYGAAVVIHRAVGDGIPNPPPEHLEIRYDDVLPDRSVLDEAVDVGSAHMAGAGAIEMVFCGPHATSICAANS